MQLFVFSTRRKIRAFLDKTCENELLQKTASLGEFFGKCVKANKLCKCQKIEQILFMREACRVVKQANETLKFPLEFYEFMKNSDYLFSFFKELAAEKKSINDLDINDTYASYSEHLKILSLVLENYKSLLNQNGFFDEITLPYIYEINQKFIKNYSKIFIEIDGILSNFEFEILTEISKICDVTVKFQVSGLNTKLVQKFSEFSGVNFDNEKIYELNLSKKKIENVKSAPQNLKVSLRAFSLRSLQCAFVFEKISSFIQAGINPKNIAVILPDEDFAEILMAHDKAFANRMLNFAMGEKFSSSAFFQILEKLTNLAKNGIFIDLKDQDNTQWSENTVFFQKNLIDADLYENFMKNFGMCVNFGVFKEIILQIAENTKNADKILAEPLFEISVLMQKNKSANLTFGNLCEILLSLLSEIKIDDVSGGEVSVLGILESRGMKFDGVIIIDFNDDLIPKRVSAEMFLSSKVRAKAGLIGHEDRENLQRFYYESLIKNAKKVAISYQENEDKIVSRFAKKFDIMYDTDYSDEAYLRVFANRKNKIFSFLQNDDPVGKSKLFDDALSFSKLDVFLSCKRKYYYAYLANIKEPKKLETQLDFASKGSLIHEVLQKIYNDFGTFNEQKFAEVYTQISKKYIISDFERELSFYRIKKVNDEIFTDFSKQGFNFEAAEKQMETEFCGVKIKGKIDRIDKNKNGETLLIDYKSGNVNDKSYQLAFYKALLGLDDSTQSYFISIKNCAKIPSKLGIDVAYESKDKIYPSLKDLIFSLKTGAQNEMKFSRSDYFEKEAKECDFCPYKIICKGEIA